MSKPKPPTRTYRLFEGYGGSAFQFVEEFTITARSMCTGSTLTRHVARFLHDKPEVHDMSWSTDDGKTYVVKRKTSEYSEVLGATDAPQVG